MRKFMLAAAICGTLTSGAHAADMPDLPFLRGSYTDGLSRGSVNWQGYYFGGQAQYGASNSKVASNLNRDMQATFFPPPNVTYDFEPLGAAHATGAGLGAFVGYNSQWDDVIWGVEANYSHDGLKSRTSSTGVVFMPDNITIQSITHSTALVKLNDFGSIRVRGGYIIDCFLPYMFVGAGFGSQTVDRTVTATPDPVRPAWTTDSSSKLIYGYTAGAGFDVMLIGGLFARAEYEFRRVTSNVDTNINSVRLGLGYKF